MLNHFLNGEGIGVVSGNEAHSIDCDERAEDGCALDDNVIIEEICKGSHNEGTCNVEAPVAGGGATNHFVGHSVVKNESEGEAAPAC
jgi:hypothetical protein